MDKLIGQTLGRYHVIEPLGEGGMASVYKAFDTSLERHVAIKIIRSDKKEGTEQNEFLKRFQREAKALAQLDHPYILKVLDYGEQEGIPYLVMPFVQGGTLRNRMGSPVPYQEAAAMLAPIAQALDYAHKRKVIHRDVKPANILLSETNTPILSDFGIAKIIESGESTQLTATGVGIGTPDYMAPEQWMGKADARTDIYSLGIVFYQLVTGHLPFSAETPAAVLIKHMQDPLPRPSTFVHNLPESVEQVLFKSLAKDPTNRFQDMAAFADALTKLSIGVQPEIQVDLQSMETVMAPISGTATPTRLSTTPTPVPTPVPAVAHPRKKMPGWAIALIVVVVVGGGALIALIAGGAFLASQLTANPEQTPVISNPVGNATIDPTRPYSTLDQSAGTLDFFATDNPSGSVPFTTIDGFPDDIPILTDNNGDLMTTTTQGMMMYGFSTNLTAKQVADFYLTGMADQGWEIMSETTQQGLYYWVFIKGDTRQVTVMLSEESGSPVQVFIQIVTQ